MKLIAIILTVLFWQQSLFAFEVHAHRGGSSNYSKNSLKAIMEALENGFYASELDVHLTKDNHFVVVHDPVINLERCTSPIQDQLTTFIVRKLSLTEVTSFKCSSDGLFPEPIPSLESVLLQSNKFQDQKLNIEVKFYNKTTRSIFDIKNDELYPKLATLVTELNSLLLKHNAYDRVIVQSFSKDFLVLIKSVSDSVTTSFLYRGSYLRVLPEKILKKNGNLRKFLWVPSYKKAFKIMEKEGFDYLSPNIGQISHFLYKGFFKKHILEARNKNKSSFKVIPWTVNSTDKIDSFNDEIDGVITDKPELFL